MWRTSTSGGGMSNGQSICWSGAQISVSDGGRGGDFHGQNALELVSLMSSNHSRISRFSALTGVFSLLFYVFEKKLI